VFRRFCFYGLRALLVLYLKNALHLSESTAVAIMSYFTAAAYTTPVGFMAGQLGGWVAGW
jgi:dipeptide/tripeptide permease